MIGRRALLTASGLGLVAACAGPTEGASVATSYATLTAVAAASALVVIAGATATTSHVPADAQAKSGDISTVTTMRATRVLKGDLSAGAEFAFRQDGKSQELVAAAETYLIYAQPFTFGDGRDLHQWTTTAVDSLYRADSADPARFTQVPCDAASLPKQVTEGEADSSVR